MRGQVPPALLDERHPARGRRRRGHALREAQGPGPHAQGRLRQGPRVQGHGGVRGPRRLRDALRRQHPGPVRAERPRSGRGAAGRARGVPRGRRRGLRAVQEEPRRGRHEALLRGRGARGFGRGLAQGADAGRRQRLGDPQVPGPDPRAPVVRRGRDAAPRLGRARGRGLRGQPRPRRRGHPAPLPHRGAARLRKLGRARDGDAHVRVAGEHRRLRGPARGARRRGGAGGPRRAPRPEAVGHGGRDVRARGERRVLLLRAAAQERLRRGPRGREAVLPPGPRRRDDDAHLPGAAGPRVHGDLRVRHVAPVRAPLQGGGRGDAREDGLLLPGPVPPRRQVRPRGHLPPAEALEDPGARRLHALQPPGARGRQARAAAAFELRDFFSRVRPHHARPVRHRRRPASRRFREISAGETKRNRYRHAR